MIEKIYLVYENADKTEGRGPMVHVKDSGFFTDIDKAWNFADTMTGVMGRKPKSGSWKHEKCGDVEVRTISRHDNSFFKRKNELESRIRQLENELSTLKSERNHLKK